MRVLATGDWHTDWSTAGFVRQSDIVEAGLELGRALAEHRIDLFVFDGDLCDPLSPRSIFAMTHAVAFGRSVANEGYAQIWITGNHDVIEDGSGYSTLHPLAQCDFENCAVAVKPRRYSLFRLDARAGGHDLRLNEEAGEIVALPYVPASHGYDPEAYIRGLKNGHQVRLVISHLMIEGHEPGSETKDMPRGRDVFLPVDAIRECLPNARVVNGHYHRAFESHGGLILGPGSLERLVQGEEHNTPGYLVIDV